MTVAHTPRNTVETLLRSVTMTVATIYIMLLCLMCRCLISAASNPGELPSQCSAEPDRPDRPSYRTRPQPCSHYGSFALATARGMFLLLPPCDFALRMCKSLPAEADSSHTATWSSCGDHFFPFTIINFFPSKEKVYPVPPGLP